MIDHLIAQRAVRMGKAVYDASQGDFDPTPEEAQAILDAAARILGVEELRDALSQARAALQKTMAAWGGTCAWHADVKAAIAAIDAARAKD